MVADRALVDLDRLIPERKTSYPVIADVDCGWGRSLPKLQQRFAPQRLIGMDIDPAMLQASAKEVQQAGIRAELICSSSSNLHLQSDSVDLLFCHQTFHHLIEQEKAIAEFYRVLRPGGILLFAESTRRYICSWMIRLLFRHPMEVQKTAEQYLALVRNADFSVAPQSISYPYLWWSREDLASRKAGSAFSRQHSAKRHQSIWSPSNHLMDRRIWRHTRRLRCSQIAARQAAGRADP